MHKTWLQPNHWVYLLCHVILILLGTLAFAFAHGTILLTGIGASLFATGIAGMVVFAYVRFTSRTAERLAILTDFGLVQAFDARSMRIEPQYKERLSRVRQKIDIMGFGLRSLREDYLATFPQWRQRADVRVLLIDPDAPDPSYTHAAQRDREEGHSPGSIESDVHSFVVETHSLLTGSAGGSFQIRLYNCLPSINVFRIDDEIFWGPYLMREQSRNTPTFLVRRGGILFARILDHFNHIWHDETLSRRVPDAWLDDG